MTAAQTILQLQHQRAVAERDRDEAQASQIEAERELEGLRTVLSGIESCVTDGRYLSPANQVMKVRKLLGISTRAAA